MSTNLKSSVPASTPAAGFHADDDALALASYRSLSVLALISLLLGLAAPLCFVAPLLIVLPLVGVALSMVALRQIAASEGMMAGRGAAAIGLALCVASMLAVFSYGQVVRALRVEQAREFGQTWLGLVQSSDSEHAFRLTGRGAQSEPAEPEPGGAKPVNPYDAFLANPLVRDLQAIGGAGKVRRVGGAAFDPQAKGNCLVEQQFSVAADPTADTGPASGQEPLQLVLTLQRARLAGDANPRWLVVSYAKENSPAASGREQGP
jgi:hypothetical protein